MVCSKRIYKAYFARGRACCAENIGIPNFALRDRASAKVSSDLGDSL